jgi:Putative Actinobacterial Holin-X, holin superfamily III
MAEQLDNRTLGDLLAELSRETSTLVKKELELASTELSAKARAAGSQVAIAAAGGALMHAGFLVILAAVVIGLTQAGLEPWLAAGLVALATMAIGYVLMNKGMTGLRRMPIAPQQTIETLKENAKWTTGQRA